MQLSQGTILLRVYVRKRRYTTNILMLFIVYLSKYIVFRDVVDPLQEHSLGSLLCNIVVDVSVVVALIDFIK